MPGRGPSDLNQWTTEISLSITYLSDLEALMPFS